VHCEQMSEAPPPAPYRGGRSQITSPHNLTKFVTNNGLRLTLSIWLSRVSFYG
jgi:hypothetical protein